jgi:hypothetical protein
MWLPSGCAPTARGAAATWRCPALVRAFGAVRGRRRQIALGQPRPGHFQTGSDVVLELLHGRSDLIDAAARQLLDANFPLDLHDDILVGVGLQLGALT